MRSYLCVYFCVCIVSLSTHLHEVNPCIHIFWHLSYLYIQEGCWMRAGEGLLQKVNQKEPQTVTPLKIITGCHFKSPFILDRLRSIDFSLSLSDFFSQTHSSLHARLPHPLFPKLPFLLSSPFWVQQLLRQWTPDDSEWQTAPLTNLSINHPNYGRRPGARLDGLGKDCRRYKGNKMTHPISYTLSRPRFIQTDNAVFRKISPSLLL